MHRPRFKDLAVFLLRLHELRPHHPELLQEAINFPKASLEATISSLQKAIISFKRFTSKICKAFLNNLLNNKVLKKCSFYAVSDKSPVLTKLSQAANNGEAAALPVIYNLH
ncbi:hypothetical protein AVEN_90647-1 [Araneus ventricosus]|uniref:Uncharacterized protein n=1 Tax=Araneus ventricosus TaxID=182803 RepID=A0A4Y2HJM5_ARAVE|nr:hypothetical protein AVEN_90647-1 [Araneus ventricosus]